MERTSTMTAPASQPKNRSTVLLTLGLAGISVFMYLYTWLKDWS
jgi:hypothetical protein